jgi:hypothetical protein
MTSVQARHVASAAAVLLLVAGAAGAQPAAGGDGASSWAEMQKCAAIADDAARHACTDEVMRKAGLFPSAQARTAARRKSFGLELPRRASATPRPEQQASAPAAAPRPAARPTPVEENDNRVRFTLTGIELIADGRLLLTTGEGAVWRQADSDPVRPRPAIGQSMLVERNVLGGFLCRIGKWTAFRCWRER